MARVQEGAFDPGPSPEPEKAPEEFANPPEKQESFREKALRRAREEKEREAGFIPWNMLDGGSDPGDEAPHSVG